MLVWLDFVPGLLMCDLSSLIRMFLSYLCEIKPTLVLLHSTLHATHVALASLAVGGEAIWLAVRAFPLQAGTRVAQG